MSGDDLELFDPTFLSRLRTLFFKLRKRRQLKRKGLQPTPVAGFTFAAPEAPPPGWTRDFVLVGDGWVKDGDLNTAFSTTVLPLPTHASQSYDTPPGDLEQDPIYQQHRTDWQRFHTRYVAHDRFRRALAGR